MDDRADIPNLQAVFHQFLFQFHQVQFVHETPHFKE